MWEPWMNVTSWFSELNGDDTLSELFPKFWNLLESDEEQRGTILRAVDWYLQSNVSPPYVGIILTVAALERLSFQVLGRERCERTGEFIKKALEQLHIPLDLPGSCETLSEIQSWEHGPHAVVAIRNDLTHPKQKYGRVSNYAIHEAWNLGQWQIEMILLHMLEYRGDYVNRLAGWGEQSQALVPVPWTEKPCSAK